MEGYEVLEGMKSITVVVDDETYRLAQIRAAEKGKSVSDMVRDYLSNLAEVGPPSWEVSFRELLESIRGECGDFNPADNLARGELYDRDAFC